jgi:rhodanese-related sulfurtransferase
MNISVTDLRQRLDKGDPVLLIDVRNPSEWAATGVILGSACIPLDTLKTRTSGFPHDATYVVVCQAGQRSQSGVAVLRQLGFSQAYSLSGGIVAWKQAGYEVVKG